MYNSESLIELHRRAHQSLQKLLTHCRELSADEFNRRMEAFGDPTVQLQLFHIISAEKYWTGVLQGRMDVDNEIDYPTIDVLEPYRQEVFAITDRYLQGASVEELNSARRMITWGNNEKILIPAHIIIRTQVHIYHHLGKTLAMCRLLGKPGPGMDYPIG
jgi:uncharacterized damage-inducible protein DinB